MSRVILFGCGRGADTAYRYLSRDGAHHVCGFTVDEALRRCDRFHDLPVVSYESVTAHFPPADFEMLVPLGFQQMNWLRAEKYLDAKRKGYRFISYVNQRHYSLEGVQFGENCFILDGQSFNLDVSVGDNVTMWSGNHVGDRTTIGNHVWISSHVTLSGDVAVGDYCFLGINSCVSNNVRLAPRTFVGANVLITQDTVDGGVYVAATSQRIQMTSDRFLSMLKIT
jgi:sugar O-acyltransferase (sialic acid O-acetyltransferase NeuD family)